MANVSNCNTSFPGDGEGSSSISSNNSGETIGKIAVLGTLLVCSVLGNGTLLATIRVSKQRGRQQGRAACVWLKKSLCVTAIIFSLHNVTAHIATTVMGGWKMGIVYCQVHGLALHVFIGTWFWLLALAGFERCTKKLFPEEHPSLFSLINTKIQASGVVMLMLVVFLGPTYGWGEYSYFRGEMPLLVQPSTAVDTNGQPVGGSHLQEQFHRYLASPESADETMAFSSRTYHFFNELRDLHIRRISLAPEGIALSIRAPHRHHVTCLQQQDTDGSLGDEITRHVVSDEMLRDLQLSNLTFKAVIHPDIANDYKETHLKYQDVATCGLDYSKVNHNIDSFVAFMLVVTVVVPLIALLVVYVRMALSKKTEALFRITGTLATPGDSHPVEDDVTNVAIPLASVLTLLIYVTYFAVNISAGNGNDVTRAAHFAGIVLLNCTPLTLCLAHALGHASWEVLRRLKSRTNHRPLNASQNLSKIDESGDELESLPSAPQPSPKQPSSTISSQTALSVC